MVAPTPLLAPAWVLTVPNRTHKLRTFSGISDELMARVQALAERRSVPAAEVVRTALEAEVRKAK